MNGKETTQTDDGSVESTENGEKQIQRYTDSARYERIPHPEDSGLAAVFRTDSLLEEHTAYLLVMTDGETFHTAPASEYCEGCNENEHYSPRMGTPPKTAQRRRTKANCGHANLAKSAFHLDTSGRCPNCGGWGIDTNEVPHPAVPGAVAMVEEQCGGCGKYRSS